MVPEVPSDGDGIGLCWSADGQNARVVACEKSKGLAEKTEGALDWR